MENRLREKLKENKKELEDVTLSLQQLSRSQQLLNTRAVELQGSIKTLEALLVPEKTLEVLKAKEMPDLNALKDGK